MSTTRTKGIPPHLIAATLRKVRTERLKLTLSEFAKALGVSMTAVTRYERERPPRGKQLALIADKIAALPGCETEASILQFAVSSEFGSWTGQKIHLDLEPRTVFEKLLIGSVLAVLRNPRYTDLLPRLAEVLLEPAKASVEALEETIASRKVAAEVTRLLKLGVPPLAVAEDQAVPLETVDAIGRLNQFTAALRESGSLTGVEMLKLLNQTKKGSKP